MSPIERIMHGLVPRPVVLGVMLASGGCRDEVEAAEPVSEATGAATTSSGGVGPGDSDGSDDPGIDTTAPAGDTAHESSSGSQGSGDCDPDGQENESGDGDGRQGAPVEYTGQQYDHGGAVTPISGTLDTVDALADSIVAQSAQTLDEIAMRRATLTYGGIDADPCAPPQLVTYPGPDGIVASDRYTVSVEQGGVAVDSFVYQTQARKPDTNRELDTSWSTFSFGGSVTVHVTSLGGDATGCIVRPGAAAIATTFVGGVCTFTLDRPKNISVEFEPNIHNPVLHPMLMFANPLEVDVPDPADPNVRWFGPGVHSPGSGQPIASGQTIYLAGGAWVDGAFIADGPVTDVAIKGRGVLSGLFMDTGNQALNKDVPGMIDIAYRDSENLLVEGITLVDGPRFNVRALADYTTVHNVKVMSWWFSTDGVVGGNKSVIEDSFIKVNDDSIKLHWGDTIARRNVLWQLENGGTFNLSWNIHDDVQTFHVHDSDVIHAEHYLYEAEAVFRSRHAGSGTLSRYLFDDIRVENANWRLFYIVLEHNKWFEPAQGYGAIEQLVFRNIHAQSETHQRPNEIRGIDGDHQVRNVSLQNVYTDGRCISDAPGGSFAIDPGSTNAIRIMKSADGSCHTP
jgi:hypothetical protein